MVGTGSVQALTRFPDPAILPHPMGYFPGFIVFPAGPTPAKATMVSSDDADYIPFPPGSDTLQGRLSGSCLVIDSAEKPPS